MVVAGFAPSSAACAAGNYSNQWYTEEGETTTAQLCAQLTDHSDQSNGYRPATVTVTDTTSIAGVCTVADGVGAIIPPGGSRIFDYSCAFTAQPAYSGTNTATVTWDGQDEPSVHSVSFTQADWNLRERLRTTTVSDTFPELAALGGQELTWTAAGTTHTFTYTHEVAGDEVPPDREVHDCDQHGVSQHRRRRPGRCGGVRGDASPRPRPRRPLRRPRPRLRRDPLSAPGTRRRHGPGQGSPEQA